MIGFMISQGFLVAQVWIPPTTQMYQPSLNVPPGQWGQPSGVQRQSPGYSGGQTPAAALLVQARAKLAKQDYQAAIADFNQALRLNPNYAYGYIDRGIARLGLGDQQGAIADFDQAVRLKPNDASAYIHRGNARSKLGDKPGAIADFNRALQLDPEVYRIYLRSLK